MEKLSHSLIVPRIKDLDEKYSNSILDPAISNCLYHSAIQ